MNYEDIAIKDDEIPVASSRIFQHLVKTYASEVNKLNSVWREFSEDDLSFKPHARSSTVGEIIENEVLPQNRTPRAFAARMVELSRERVHFLSKQTEDWWLAVVPFFDVERERIWIFWRRVLHTAHHRAQLGAYLRMLNKKVPSIYGPTADVRWEGADPTSSVAAASRK
jgi:hypothetical protein